MIFQHIMRIAAILENPIIDINVKNIKNDKILREKHCLILGNVYFCTYGNLGNV